MPPGCFPLENQGEDTGVAQEDLYIITGLEIEGFSLEDDSW